ncbi:MAG: MASE4 domain-containing protein [Magnetospirillum sp.]|nr:MASE4 domain-containing protein [Magnetospirillum sp.]
MLTVAPSSRHRRLVALLAGLLVLVTVVLWPHASDAGPELLGFVGAYQTAVAICDLLTAVLLFNQFAQVRTANLLILSGGYLFTAAIVTIHLGSFPGVFTADGIIGGDANTPPWLWTFWHSMFPITALLYAVVHRPVAAPPQRAIAVAVILTGGAVVAAFLFSTRHGDALPPMIADRAFSPFFLGALYPMMIVLCLAALAALLFVRTGQPIITLYLGLAVLAFLLDVVNNWHSGARYAVGWYVGRANSLVASVLLCAVFLIENVVLLRYANRAAAHLADLNQALNAASAEKSRFFAAASHDLRQPFQAMRLFFDVLAGGADDRQRQVVDRLGHAMGAAETLLNDLLDAVRLESGVITPHPQEVDFGRLMADLKAELEPMATRKGLSLSIRHPPAVLRTDPALLRRVLVNLVTNAIRYTERGGVLIGLRRRADKVLVEVWDTGIGITGDQAERIFDEFYQVADAARPREQGLGLGLAIVKRLSEMLGYEVTLTSRLGKGTVFRVVIPAQWPESLKLTGTGA